MKAQVVEQVTVAQAKTAIAQTAALYFAKDANGRYRIDRRRARPVCLMGPAGIGKTEVVRQVAEEQGLAFLSYSVTHHTRQSAIGLPRLSECEVDGRTVPITEYTMSEIIAEVYRVMRESGKKEGILFLDEFNCESETLRPIMLQLLQSKTFGPHTIPDGWMLVLAGNPSEYNVSARALDAVTADRLRMLWLQPDYNAWRAYMVSRGVHPVVLSYLDDHRRQFYVFEKGKDGEALVTARGWEDLSVMLRMMEEFGYINSPGGLVTAGLAILDTMHHICCDVSTICVGQAASMGAVLLAAGTKGKRRVLPNCEVMIHQPLSGVQGQATDIQIHAEHTLAIKARLTQLMAEFCGKDAAEIGADMERDHFLTAQEAVNYGLADAVVQ